MKIRMYVRNRLDKKRRKDDMKSELLILWAEKVSGAAICNLGEAFMTIYKKALHYRCTYVMHIY